MGGGFAQPIQQSASHKHASANALLFLSKLCEQLIGGSYKRHNLSTLRARFYICCSWMSSQFFFMFCPCLPKACVDAQFSPLPWKRDKNPTTADFVTIHLKLLHVRNRHTHIGTQRWLRAKAPPVRKPATAHQNTKTNSHSRLLCSSAHNTPPSPFPNTVWTPTSNSSRLIVKLSGSFRLHPRRSNRLWSFFTFLICES